VSTSDKLPGPANTRAVLEKTALGTLSFLGATRETGLSTSDAQGRLAQIGANEVPESRERPLARFARKFWGLSAWMLELIVFLSLIRPKMET
jgi:H+-transporting ATPase